MSYTAYPLIAAVAALIPPHIGGVSCAVADPAPSNAALKAMPVAAPTARSRQTLGLIMSSDRRLHRPIHRNRRRLRRVRLHGVTGRSPSRHGKSPAARIGNEPGDRRGDGHSDGQRQTHQPAGFRPAAHCQPKPQPQTSPTSPPMSPSPDSSPGPPSSCSDASHGGGPTGALFDRPDLARQPLRVSATSAYYRGAQAASRSGPEMRGKHGSLAAERTVPLEATRAEAPIAGCCSIHRRIEQDGAVDSPY